MNAWNWSGLLWMEAVTAVIMAVLFWSWLALHSALPTTFSWRSSNLEWIDNYLLEIIVVVHDAFGDEGSICFAIFCRGDFTARTCSPPKRISSPSPSATLLFKNVLQRAANVKIQKLSVITGLSAYRGWFGTSYHLNLPFDWTEPSSDFGSGDSVLQWVSSQLTSERHCPVAAAVLHTPCSCQNLPAIPSTDSSSSRPTDSASLLHISNRCFFAPSGGFSLANFPFTDDGSFNSIFFSYLTGVTKRLW